jgi:hypothetical protein
VWGRYPAGRAIHLAARLPASSEVMGGAPGRGPPKAHVTSAETCEGEIDTGRSLRPREHELEQPVNATTAIAPAARANRQFLEIVIGSQRFVPVAFRSVRHSGTEVTCSRPESGSACLRGR